MRLQLSRLQRHIWEMYGFNIVLAASKGRAWSKYNIYVGRKVRICAIHGFRCANHGSYFVRANYGLRSHSVRDISIAHAIGVMLECDAQSVHVQGLYKPAS